MSKNIPKLRFKEFENEWENENYFKCIEMLPNISKYKIPKSEILNNGKFPVITQEKEFISGFQNDENKIIKDKEYIVFGDHTTIFKYINFTFTIGADGTQVFKTKENINLLFYYYLSLNLIKPTGYNRHFKLLKEKLINFPQDPKEQDKIASFINSFDIRLEQLNKKKELLEEYTNGVMQQIFSQKIRFKKEDGSSYEDWEEKELKNLYNSSMGSTILKKNLIENGLIVYSATEDNKIFGYVDKEHKKEKQLKYGDLVTSARGTIGSVKFVENISIGTQTTICSKKTILNNDFLSYIIFKILTFKRNSYFKSAKGGIPQITIKDFNKISLNIPTNIKEQEKIANFLQSLSKQIEQVEIEIEESTKYKNGLLQQMFV